MTAEYRTRRFVEFSDTDMAGIVHFSHFFRYMEAAEHEFFRSLGFRLHQDHEDRMEGWARVHAGCDFERPLTYGDTVEIQVQVTTIGEKSLTFAITFRKLGTVGDEESTGAVVARGTLKTVHVVREPGDAGMRAAPIPAAVRAALEADGGPGGASA